MNFLTGAIGVFLLYLMISLLWQLAEEYWYGIVTPRKLDDVIAIVLAISLYLNLK